MATLVLKRESDNYWNLIKDASNEVKLVLIKRLSDALRPAVAEKKTRKKTADEFAGAWADMDDDMLNAALAKFHKEWGGEEDAMKRLMLDTCVVVDMLLDFDGLDRSVLALLEDPENALCASCRTPSPSISRFCRATPASGSTATRDLNS